MNIILTEKQISYATEMGKKRHKYDSTIGARGAYNISKKMNSTATLDIQGCVAEYAVSLLLNKEWIGFSENFQNIESDVGNNLQIRSTYLPHGNLILHQKDADNQKFVLVKLHNLPNVDVVGWVMGKDAKQEQFWTEPVKNRPCYMYPSQLLQDMDDIETHGDKQLGFDWG
tara:strand:- start:592 stop:1104 length:513 start_codon:yes stop_codon:yes gene_type:complete